MPTTMRAAVVRAFGRPLTIEEFRVPTGEGSHSPDLARGCEPRVRESQSGPR
jgi:hypothetical protein